MYIFRWSCVLVDLYQYEAQSLHEQSPPPRVPTPMSILTYLLHTFCTCIRVFSRGVSLYVIFVTLKHSNMLDWTCSYTTPQSKIHACMRVLYIHEITKSAPWLRPTYVWKVKIDPPPFSRLSTFRRWCNPHFLIVSSRLLCKSMFILSVIREFTEFLCKLEKNKARKMFVFSKSLFRVLWYPNQSKRMDNQVRPLSTNQMLCL